MGWYEYLVGGLLILASLIIILVILLQEGRRAGIAGAISGGADTFLSKNQARSANAKLARWTKYVIIAFVVLTLVANVFSIYLS